MTIDLIKFDNIDGVQINYARSPVAHYGTRGKGPRNVRLERNFHLELAACLTDLWIQCPYGKAEVLVSGGCYVEKAGRHGQGRAIDIDAIWWPSTGNLTDGLIRPKPLITLNAPDDAIRYLAVEAVLRKHFGTVLDFWFGHGHEDHFHVDNGQPQGWTGRPPTLHAETLFLQAALAFVHGQKVDIDGVLGTETRSALSAVQGAAYCEDIGKTWNSFLDLTASSAFSQIV